MHPKPVLPIHHSHLGTRLSVGPAAITEQLACYDRLIVEQQMKKHLTNFIVVQDVNGRFKRPVADERSLAKMILKLARKRIARSTRPISWASAIYKEAREFVDFYSSKKGHAFATTSLERGFNDLFPGFLAQQVAKGAKHHRAA